MVSTHFIIKNLDSSNVKSSINIPIRHFSALVFSSKFGSNAADSSSQAFRFIILLEYSLVLLSHIAGRDSISIIRRSTVYDIVKRNPLLKCTYIHCNVKLSTETRAYAYSGSPAEGEMGARGGVSRSSRLYELRSASTLVRVERVTKGAPIRAYMRFQKRAHTRV